MTPQELKNSILQLAIQGRLVDQNTNDLPVDLSGIKQKKTDDFEFELPANWMLAHLETVTKSVPSKQYQILESQVLQAGQFLVISQSKAYSIGFSNESEKVFHHDKPIIVFGDHTAEVKFVEFDFVVGADGVKIFEPIYDIITARFLFYVFQFYSRDLNKVGGYSRHYKYIKDKPIPVPPLAEQKRIVAKIEELLPYVERYEQAWSKLEDFNKRFPVDMQKSILQMAIQGKLVEQRPEEGTGEELYQQIQKEKQALIKAGKIKKEKPLPEISEDEIPFDIPVNWRWVRLKEVTTKITDGTHHSPPNYEIGAYKYVTAKNIKDSGISISNITFVSETVHKEIYARCNPEYGDVLLIKDGATTGVVTVNDLCEPFSMLSSVALLKMPENFCAWYLVYVLRSDLFYKTLRTQMKGTGITRITLKQIEPLVIPLPPLAEQKRIAAKLEEILPLCERLK